MEKPGARFDTSPRCRVLEGHGRAREPIEGSGGRKRVGEIAVADDANVFLRIQQYVAERVANLGRRAEVVAVIALGPETPLSAKQQIQPTRDTNLEPGNATREPALVGRFDDEMQVIRLNRE